MSFYVFEKLKVSNVSEFSYLKRINEQRKRTLCKSRLFPEIIVKKGNREITLKAHYFASKIEVFNLNTFFIKFSGELD